VSACEHLAIHHDEHGIWCSDCGAAVVLRTKSGHVVTPDDLDRWISEADDS